MGYFNDSSEEGKSLPLVDFDVIGDHLTNSSTGEKEMEMANGLFASMRITRVAMPHPRVK